jgi:hypothetical protein
MRPNRAQSERDSSGARSAYRNARKRMRYERSEPRIARRKPKKARIAGFFCAQRLAQMNEK